MRRCAGGGGIRRGVDGTEWGLVRTRTVSAFSIGDGLAIDDATLDLAAFSRFKHGAVAPAWLFAGQILDRLEVLTPDTLSANRLVVTGSCFKYVPLASVTLARSLAHLLNRRRAALMEPPVSQTQLYRAQLIEGDYSTMSLSQRRRFIDQDVIRVDPEVLAGAEVLVVDDVRITGFHEGRIAALLNDVGVAEATFAYWAVIDGSSDPVLEKRLNTTAIRDLDSMAELVAAGDFALNSRVCKLILSAPAPELAAFLGRLPVDVLAELVAGMECNGYATMRTYRPAYELMLSALGSRAPVVVS
jgi:phosphoribosyl transferase-like protein